MSRAGVQNDIAERVLGHVIAGVRGVYDRHDYLDEKKGVLWSAWQSWWVKFSTCRSTTRSGRLDATRCRYLIRLE